jgi:hypothetical protein
MHDDVVHGVDNAKPHDQREQVVQAELAVKMEPLVGRTVRQLWLDQRTHQALLLGFVLRVLRQVENRVPQPGERFGADRGQNIAHRNTRPHDKARLGAQIGHRSEEHLFCLVG